MTALNLSLATAPALAALLSEAGLVAQSLGHRCIGTEHLLLVLMRQDGDAQRFLTSHGIQAEQLEERTKTMLGTAEPLSEPPVGLTMRGLAAVRYSEDNALLHGRDWTPIYLLWSIVQDGDSYASQLLIEQGAEMRGWTSALEERLGEPTRRRPGVYTLAPDVAPGHRAELLHWRERLKSCGSFLAERVIGQPQAIERISQTLIRSWAGLKEGGRPLAGLLLVGPAGTGKASMARALAEFLFQDERRCLRFDMNSFTEENRFARFIGGSGAGDPEGLLPRLVREFPYSVLCFEDAHRSYGRILNILEEILATGQTTDGRGQRLDFRECLVVLHVNIDPDLMAKTLPMGIRRGSELSGRLEKAEETLLPELERALGNEILSQVDDLVLFRPLQTQDTVRLLERWTIELSKRLEQRRGIRIEVRMGVLEWLARRSRETGEGASALQRLCVREVENRLGTALLNDVIDLGDAAVLEMKGDEPQWSRSLDERSLTEGRKAENELGTSPS
jgi:ATP-dependent Clp protease ATP-binding subunit ClpA